MVDLRGLQNEQRLRRRYANIRLRVRNPPILSQQNHRTGAVPVHADLVVPRKIMLIGA